MTSSENYTVLRRPQRYDCASAPVLRSWDALRKIEMLASWKNLLEMAKKRRQIDEITDEMLSQEFATRVFQMHYEFQGKRQYQTANSILKALASGNVMKLVAKDDDKHAMGQTLMKKYSSGDMGSY